MGILAVLAAGAAAWAFGAVWYMMLGQRWMDAAGVTEAQTRETGPLPYLLTLVTSIIVAGMFRHVLVTSGIDEVGKAVLTGLGLGAFIALPWMVNNILFSVRSRQLIWMDGGYPVIGMAIMGLILGLFAPGA